MVSFQPLFVVVNPNDGTVRLIPGTGLVQSDLIIGNLTVAEPPVEPASCIDSPAHSKSETLSG
jgi:hypothetical protein